MSDYSDKPKLWKPSDQTSIIINNAEFLIGRSLSCDHVIEKEQISRAHCVIKKQEDKWVLYDKSLNGTLINDHLVKANESLLLKTGDVIKLAGIDHIFIDANETLLVKESEDALHDKKVDSDRNPDENSTKAPTSSQNKMDLMDNELSCSICSELFIKAVTLACSHSFCRHCIDQWRRNKQTCPICRVSIKSCTPTIVLDNLIDKMMESQSDEVKETRKAIVAERLALAAPIPSTSGMTSSNDPSEGELNDNSVIEINSDDNDDEDEDEEHFTTDSGDYDDYDRFHSYSDDYSESDEVHPDYNGLEGHYFGGYGRCFSCGDARHWANGCPNKSSRR